MEPVSITIITYVSLKFVDQFIKEEGYGRLKKFFFPTQSYQNRLVKIIYETIDVFEAKKPIDRTPYKFPFYHSQILFDELNKYILFNNSNTDHNSVIELLKTNSNIIIPSTNDLETFFETFTTKIKCDNKLKKLFIEENYKTKIFDLGEGINKIENKIDAISSTIQSLHIESTFQPNEKWFIEQCKSSIDDLGKRYTPELNVILEISEIFEGLGRTEEFKRKVTKLFDQLLIKGKKVLKAQPEVKDSIESLENNFDKLHSLFHNTEFLGTSHLPIEEFDSLLNNAQNIIQRIYDLYITEERKLQKEKNEHQYYHKYGYELRNIREFEQELSIFQNLIHGPSFKLANNPFLLLDGDAGIGKSHLIGDVVSRRMKKEHKSIFLQLRGLSPDRTLYMRTFIKFQKIINGR